MDRTKLVELQKVLENSNKKLLSDLETLELQKIELEGEVLTIFGIIYSFFFLIVCSTLIFFSLCLRMCSFFKLRQKESDKEILNFSLQKKEVELASTNSKISDLIGHIDKSVTIIVFVKVKTRHYFSL